MLLLLLCLCDAVTVWAKHRAAGTVVLMSDTHKPLPLPSKTSALHFTSLAAIVNAHYACSHGFDFLFLRLSDSGCVVRALTCTHAPH